MASLNFSAPMLSLLFGFLAWTIPFLGRKKGWKQVLLSLLCCAVSLGSVVLYIWTEARAGDFSAIQDTARGFTVAVIVMVAGTLLSCGMCLLRSRRKEA